MPGTHISPGKSQITAIEDDGFWLLTAEGEFFVSFERYPAFEQAIVSQVFNFRESFGDFHWDELDIDIELDALKHPEGYPLIFQAVQQPQVAEKKPKYK
ncbi:MAG: DUF2442 domain-containing protein [Anaerolineales bacterium]